MITSISAGTRYHSSSTQVTIKIRLALDYVQIGTLLKILESQHSGKDRQAVICHSCFREKLNVENFYRYMLAQRFSNAVLSIGAWAWYLACCFR